MESVNESPSLPQPLGSLSHHGSLYNQFPAVSLFSTVLWYFANSRHVYSLLVRFFFLPFYSSFCPRVSRSSRGGDVTVYVLSPLTTLFILFLCLFLYSWPFQLYLIPLILSTTLRFFILFFWSYFCIIGPFNYTSLYESLPQPCYNPLWLTGL